MDAASPPVVGIDLGTTFSCIAYYDKGRRELIPDINGDTLIMSFVYFAPEDGKVYVGKHAYDLSRHCPSNGIRDSKRLIGRKYDDEFVQKYIKSHHTFSSIVNDENNMATFSLKICNKTVLKSPEDISAEILNYLKKSAESYLGTGIEEAVISIPAYFNNAQRKATRKAADIAGLNVLKFITEPTAAALYYVKDKSINANLLIFDWGGGTLDISLIQIRNKVFEVKTVYGDSLLGGSDIDEALFNHFFVPVKKHSNPFKRRLLDECITLKEALSVIPNMTKFLDFYDGINTMDLSMNIQKFEDLARVIFQRVFDIIEYALLDSGWSKSDIDQVILVGGSTRIPKIRNMLAELFGNPKINKDLNPDFAVASGTCIQAHFLKCSNTELENYKITEVTPLSLGIGSSENLMIVFIKRNTSLPHTVSHSLVTVYNNQKYVTFPIYEGERKNDAYNNKLGELTIDGLPPKRAGDVKFDVIFQLDGDGILTVKASETSTGKTNALAITMGEFRLSEKKVKYSKEDATKCKLEDDVFEEFVILKKRLFKCCRHILYEREKIKNSFKRNEVKIECEQFLQSADILKFTQIDVLERSFKVMHDKISDSLIKNNIVLFSDNSLVKSYK